MNNAIITLMSFISGEFEALQNKLLPVKKCFVNVAVLVLP